MLASGSAASWFDELDYSIDHNEQTMSRNEELDEERESEWSIWMIEWSLMMKPDDEIW